ncbi:MAG: translation initiation factor IF-2, partial [Clostridia bacterium]
NGTGGYQGSNPNGGYQGNNQSGGYQGGNPSGGYQGNNPSGGYQGNRPFNNNFNPNGGRPPRPNAMNIAATAPPFPVPKGATKKPPVKAGQNNNAKFDDRNALNKRALFQRGYEGAPKVYIADGTAVVLDEEQIKIRTKKNRNINSSGQIVIEHAIITTDPVSIKVLSDKIGKTATEIIKILFSLSIIKTINENIDFETAELVAEELNITLEYKPDVTFEDTLIAKHDFDDIDELDKLIARPPVVTIMGHVDHGKTSLLDYIRKAHVTSGEAGGITQHIGAYTVSLKGSPITFLDTPGHEAFTSMRARGAQVTDIAVLVVAADDGIMPQTIEAINHAKQAKVPIIVAVNKMDKVAADPDRILQQLSDHEILPEEWGGDTPVVKVSAKTGAGVDELLSNILTLAEIKELRANPNRNARGTIIEARLDKGLGKIATILVQNGTLRVGDNVVAGVCTGKIRAMIDDKGKNIRKAGPSIPVSVTGWDEVPEAGDHIDVVNDEKFAHELADERRIKTAGANNETMSVNLNDLFEKIQKGELKSVKLIIKADVQGSLEAVKQSLSKLSNEEVGIDIIHGGVGTIKESDVLLAETANAIIIGFNVRADIKSKQIAAQKKIDIRYYDVIYNAIEDIEKAVKGLLEPKFKEVILGTAEIREVFRIGGVGTIAGSHVMDGKIIRGSKARLLRDGKVEYTGEIASLRHNKDDVKEMAKNFDCGIMLTNYMDFKQGDIIEAFQMEKIVDED